MAYEHDLTVYIGRFQPFHLGHLALLQQGLQRGEKCVVVLGSCHQARTPRNPFTRDERIAMINLNLTPEEQARVVFVSMRDYYDDARWVDAVRREVGKIAAQGARIGLIGHFKDATSDYLRRFPGWNLMPQDRMGAIDAVHLRDALFQGKDDPEAALAVVAPHVPAGTLGFLRAWLALPFLLPLSEEWRTLRAYKAEWAMAPYPPVFTTVDAVLRCKDHVLLIQRGQAPGKGLFAVPGGFLEARETVYQSAVRELREETHLGLLESDLAQALRNVAVFDHPDRSQRGRIITHAHYFELDSDELPEVRGGDDAASAQWVAIADLAAMEDRFHDDHFHMLDHFLGITDAGAGYLTT